MQDVPGLREQQKADRKHRIISAAELQFRELGYEDTKIENIANAAGVSVGTVYNYAENKSDLLMILVMQHIDFVKDEIDEIIKNPPANLIDAVSSLFVTMTRHSLDHLGKDNWRHLFALSIAHRETMIGERFAQYNGYLHESIVRMLVALQAKSVLAKNCDTERLGSILFRVETMHYIDLTSNDGATFDAYKKAVQEDMQFILQPYATEL